MQITGRTDFLSWLKRLFCIHFFLLNLSVALAGQPQVVLNFDWDRNVVHPPSFMHLYHPEDLTERFASAWLWDQFTRGLLPRDHEIHQYEKKGPAHPHEFRPPLDAPDSNYFAHDISLIIQKESHEWKGPDWSRFQQALRFPETAEKVTIITGRSNPPEWILEGLRVLQRARYIQHLPLVSNIFCINHNQTERDFTGELTPIRKMAAATRLLDELQQKPLIQEHLPFVSRAGNGMENIHVWYFSDDSRSNIEYLKAKIGEQIKSGRWDRIKIVMNYTGSLNGPNDPLKKMIVARPDGTWRTILPFEMKEIDMPQNSSCMKSTIGKVLD